jgi:hypothetical protein
MRTRLFSLNGAVTLGIIAFLTLMARITLLDSLFVSEFRTMLPEDQPVRLALVMLGYMVFVGGWVWSLLAAVRGSQAGLMVLLVFSLLTQR